MKKQHDTTKTRKRRLVPKRKPSRPPKLELELLTPTTLLEHERVPSGPERAPLVELGLLVRVGVVAAVEAGAQLRVAEHLVRLVDAGHLLLGFLLGQPLLGRFVRVVQLGELAVGGLDLALVGVVRHAENLVVVLCLAALEGDLGFLQERVDDVVFAGVELGGFAERVDAGFVVFGGEEVFGAVEEAVEGGFVEGEGLVAVVFGFFAVGL